MTTLSIIPADAIVIHNTEVRTNSLKVAEAFGRRHADVLATIKNLDCSAGFTSANFFAHVGKIQAGAVKRNSKFYEMTKDGFIFLVMGFTGKLAAQIKEAYINAFNQMAEKLKDQHRQSSTDDRTGLRNAVNMLVSKKRLLYPDAYNLIHQRFNVEHLDELTKEQLPAAVEYIHRLVLEGEWLQKESATQSDNIFGSQSAADEVLLYIDDLCNCVHSVYVDFYEQEFVRFLRKSGNSQCIELINKLGDANHYVGQLMHRCQSEIQQSKTRLRVEKIGCN